MEHIISHSIMNHLMYYLTTSMGVELTILALRTQLIAFIKDVSHALDHQKQFDIILLDLSKLLIWWPHTKGFFQN